MPDPGLGPGETEQEGRPGARPQEARGLAAESRKCLGRSASCVSRSIQGKGQEEEAPLKTSS